MGGEKKGEVGGGGEGEGGGVFPQVAAAHAIH